MICVLLLRRYHELSRSEFIWINVVINRESHNEPNLKLMSCVICHMSGGICHMSYIMFHMSGVIYHVSYVMCHMAYVIYVRDTKLYFFYHKVLSNERRENTILGKKKIENRFSISMTAQQAIHTSRVQYNINVSTLFYCRLDMYDSK